MKNEKFVFFQTLVMKDSLRKSSMREKSFLEILSEKIEKQVKADISQANKPSNYQTEITQNVDNSTENHPGVPQWISQIPLEKIRFQAPKQQIFGRIYPLNTPKPKAAASRKKHLLSEIQKQSVIYFWSSQIRLQEDFTMQELKKAFRTLAHKLHPDRNQGRSKAFMELKAHYQCLLSVFNAANT